jgi:hypothetical protein
MRRAHYSKQAPRSTDWGSIFRNVLIVLVLVAAAWWLMTGPAQEWFESLSDWLNNL